MVKYFDNRSGMVDAKSERLNDGLTAIFLLQDNAFQQLLAVREGLTPIAQFYFESPFLAPISPK